MQEIWKDIPDYEGLYQASNSGSIRKFGDEEILRPRKSGNYLIIDLTKNSFKKTLRVHQIVAITFLNHKPNRFNGFIVDHIDNNPINNKVDNLQLISQRKNCSKDKDKGSSKHVGVHWNKRRSMWKVDITLENKKHYLGYYDDENIAKEKYELALYNWENFKAIPNYRNPNKTSSYKNISFAKATEKWVYKLTINKKEVVIGRFISEDLAVRVKYIVEYLIKKNTNLTKELISKIRCKYGN